MISVLPAISEIFDKILFYQMCLSMEHDLKLNSPKFKLMLFGSKNKISIVKASLNINIGSTTLPIVDEAKCLGTIFDSNMKFKGHVKTNAEAYYSLKINIFKYPFLILI